GGISTGTGVQLISNGSNLKLSASKAGAAISIGDQNQFKANGGSIAVTSAGQLNVGTTGGAGSSMVARNLTFTTNVFKSGGGITLSGSTGIAVGDNVQLTSNKTLSMAAAGSLSAISIGNNDVVTAGLLNASPPLSPLPL